MKLELKEYMKSGRKETVLTESFKNIEPVSKDSIMQDIEGIHEGPTGNLVWYTKSALESSLESWTKPYQKPLIMHHNSKNGVIIGRVVAAKLKEHNTRSGTPAIVFTCNIPDKNGKEQVLDGRLKTTSIGVTATEGHCSICGQDLELDPNTNQCICGHIKGAIYDGKVCYWVVTKMVAKELSYVIVPSDKYAHNIKTYYPDGTIINIQESLSNNNNKIILQEGESEKMDKPKINKDLEEGTVINEVTGEATNDKEVNTEVEANAKDIEEVNTEETVETVEALKAKVKELEEMINEHKKTVLETKKLLIAAQDEIDNLTTKVEEETNLKKAVEDNLLEAKTELRESLENNVNSFREMLNKEPLAKEVLSARATSSLKDSLIDLKEELIASKSRIDLNEAKDPTIKRQKDEFEKNVEDKCVKENKTNSNINMTESLKSINAFNFIKEFSK